MLQIGQFAVIVTGISEDFQRWLEIAKNYDLRVDYSNNDRSGMLVIEEVEE